MDDVIFGGTAKRPARNIAEVIAGPRQRRPHAPAASSTTSTRSRSSRRIERGTGSTYRINGREVRARDVQLLFADAGDWRQSPGPGQPGPGSARSSAPSRRSAAACSRKPPASPACIRAATRPNCGCARAETNLERLDDVIGALEGQLPGPAAPGAPGDALPQDCRTSCASSKRCCCIALDRGDGLPRGGPRAPAAKRAGRERAYRPPPAPRPRDRARRPPRCRGFATSKRAPPPSCSAW